MDCPVSRSETDFSGKDYNHVSVLFMTNDIKIDEEHYVIYYLSIDNIDLFGWAVVSVVNW